MDIRMDQEILCLENFGDIRSGFHRGSLGRWFYRFQDESPRVSFRRRGDVEEDPKYLQIIPYVIAERGPSILSYCRSPEGGENRLHGKWSIGFGGHIERQDSQSDWTVESIVEQAALRELREELGFVGLVFPLLEGFVYDPSNPVGSVHLGVVYRVDLSHKELKFGEEVHLPTWTSFDKLDPELLETWSQLVVGEFKRF